jgi:hypothetical protein
MHGHLNINRLHILKTRPTLQCVIQNRSYRTKLLRQFAKLRCGLHILSPEQQKPYCLATAVY